MKKKLHKKLSFDKTTVAHLNSTEQSVIRGGWETDPMSGCPTGPADTCNTYCGTCVTQCGTSQTDCVPCDTERPRDCGPFPV